jgi:flotillin
MGITLFLLVLFGVALIGAPIGLNITHHDVGGMSSAIMMGSGIALIIACSILITITKLYVRTKSDEAFVRTGMGGLKVVRDGGSLVLPIVHQVVKVSLRTIKLPVVRKEAEALITSDKLRADIQSEFFVRIQPSDEDIQAAARSLGDVMNEVATNQEVSRRGYQELQKNGVSALIEDKLISALRTAAATKTLEQLNSERDEFLKEVTNLVTADLKHNGFTLETVTISSLDQTSEDHLKPGNIFDAQGMRAIAEITQKNLTEKNQIMKAGEQARKQQDVETQKKVWELEQNQAEASAKQAAQIAVVKAEQDRITKEKELEATRSVDVAKITQAQMTEVANRAKDEAIIQADQKVQVATRIQQSAVADAEAIKAQAEAKLADAEALRTKAQQGILTVEAVAKAERDKQTAVLAADAAASKDFVTAQKRADAEAYKVSKDANARKEAADAEAEAMTKKAKAEAESARLGAEGSKAAQLAQAEGQKALQLAQADGQKAVALAQAEGQKALAMVPVEVNARQVEVDKQRVEEVLKPELEAREKSGKVAQDFELSKLRIEQECLVRVETAKAMATIYGKITANVYGTPEDVAKMGKNWSDGMGLSQAFGGFMAGADSSTASTVQKGIEVVEKLATAASERLSPKSSTPAE